MALAVGVACGTRVVSGESEARPTVGKTKKARPMRTGQASAAPGVLGASRSPARARPVPTDVAVMVVDVVVAGGAKHEAQPIRGPTAASTGVAAPRARLMPRDRGAPWRPGGL